jgi:hypothetical protein
MRTTTVGTDGPKTGVLGLGRMGMSYGCGMAAPRDEETSALDAYRAMADHEALKVLVQP